MRRLSNVLVLAVAIALAACTSIWAQAISKRVMDDLLSIQSYRARIVERGMIPGDADAKLVREVTYQKLWKVRSEVKEPVELAGQVAVFDGDTAIFWWPSQLFGIRVRGLPVPSEKEARRHAERVTKEALREYAFSMDGQFVLAGQPAARWKVIPLKRGPFRFPHDSWVHERYSFPLKLAYYDEERLWYGMEFESLEFGVPAASDAFTLQFPPNAVVFDWDFSAPGISMEEARRTMNFKVRVPKKLPEGHEVRKIVRGQHCLPMVTLLMDRDGTWISLAESRAMGGMEIATGKKLKVGEEEAYLNFLGYDTVVSWSKGGTYLTLITNLPFQDALSIAESVE